MRLFLAIDVSNEVEEYLKKIQQSIPGRKVDSFHLTLKFFDDEEPEDIENALHDFSFRKFSLTLARLGAFPNSSHARVIWVGLKDSPKLKEVHKKINNRLKLKDDFDFHPHITLSRSDNAILPLLELEQRTFEVQEIILYQSTLTSNGPIYNIIKKFKGS